MSTHVVIIDRDSFTPRHLEAPNQFIIEVNSQGFNAYQTTSKGERELIETSASVLTFAAVMARIIHDAGFAEQVHFLAVKLD
jgi:hypothetical protein